MAVLMPVGPAAAEVERFHDAAASLAALEPAVRWLVVVDDCNEDRSLAAGLARQGLMVVVLRSPLDARGAALEDRVTANVLSGLRWAAQNTTAEIVMKIDTDALVIAPFAAKLAAGFARDAVIGLLGSYDQTCTGAPRDFGPWVGPVRQASRVLRWRRRPRRLGHPELALRGRAARARRYVREARAAGYQWGEHALGAAFAIPRDVVTEWAADGVLDDPCTFLGTRLFDDPVLGILVRRSGRRLAGMVDEGDPFALTWQGLPGAPEELQARGYSIIHSVKNDARRSEAEIRAFFRRQRAPSSRADAGSER